VVVEGATHLPTNTENVAWEGVQHWCDCLSELRRSLPDSEWHVEVEDPDMQWRASIQWSGYIEAFDPWSAPIKGALMNAFDSTT
jgi:hypothetical protein